MELDEVLERIKACRPMTLEEAKRRRDVFMEKYGNALECQINDALDSNPHLERLTASREVVEAIQEAFQRWPLEDENGEEFVGNCCFAKAGLQVPHVLFKGIAITYDT